MPLVSAEYQYYHGLLRRVAARSNQGRNDGEGGGGAQFPWGRMAAEILTMSKVGYSTSMPYICFRETSRFEHGGAKLASCLGRHLNL